MAMKKDEKDMDWVPARLRTKERVKKGELLIFKSICIS